MKWIGYLVILIASFSSAQYSSFNGDCKKGGQSPVTQGLLSSGTEPIGGGALAGASGVIASYPSCIVSVYFTGTGTLATIYSTAAGTVLTQPFTANTDGSYLFFTATGVYDVIMSGAGMPSPVTLTAINIGGAGGSGTGTVTTAGLTMPPGLFAVSGSPITTAGSFTVSYATIAPHTYLGNNTGASALAALVRPVVADVVGAAPSANPFFSGTVTLPITGATNQCLHVSTTGVLSGTGSDCGSGGGGGGVTSVGLVGTPNQITVTGGNPITSTGSWIVSLPGTLILPDGTTATTKAVGDSSNKVATNAFVLANQAVVSVFNRLGAVTALTGDYNVTQVTGAAPSASPTLTGTITLPFTGGAPQCLHVSSLGVLSGTGADCGSGGGGSPGGVQNALQYNGGGTFAGLNSPTQNGTYSVIYPVTGSASVSPVAALPGVPVNPQTGLSYIIGTGNSWGDRLTYVSYSNASAIAAGLPSASSAGTNWAGVQCNHGAGTVTISPATSTISYTTGSAFTNAASSMTLTTGQCAWIYSDNTNYFAIRR